jgi:hypothetical protein
LTGLWSRVFGKILWIVRVMKVVHLRPTYAIVLSQKHSRDSLPNSFTVAVPLGSEYHLRLHFLAAERCLHPHQRTPCATTNTHTLRPGFVGDPLVSRTITIRSSRQREYYSAPLCPNSLEMATHANLLGSSTPLANQVAGHQNVLADASGSLVIKVHFPPASISYTVYRRLRE